jgi:hypothetical protein
MAVFFARVSQPLELGLPCNEVFVAGVRPGKSKSVFFARVSQPLELGLPCNEVFVVTDGAPVSVSLFLLRLSVSGGVFFARFLSASVIINIHSPPLSPALSAILY